MNFWKKITHAYILQSKIYGEPNISEFKTTTLLTTSYP